MNAQDKVKLSIYTRTSGIISMIVSRGSYEEFSEEICMIETSQIHFVVIAGRLNDADGNSITVTLEKSCVEGFDIVELNSSF